MYSKQEQRRINAQLEVIDKNIINNKRIALDVGAGTGNLTGKLLQMGYQVTATDISPEMCAVLKKKYSNFISDKLKIIKSPIEELTFSKGQFDLITFYSVLHHLPDYISALKKICSLIKKGGIIYIDHEASPYYWETEKRLLPRIIKGLTFHSNPIINSIYFQIIGFRIPILDYTLSDYWHKKEHSINHEKIKQIFMLEKFESYKRTDHYLTGTWFPNPLSNIYHLVCKPEMSFWVAQK